MVYGDFRRLFAGLDEPWQPVAASDAGHSFEAVHRIAAIAAAIIGACCWIALIGLVLYAEFWVT